MKHFAEKLSQCLTESALHSLLSSNQLPRGGFGTIMAVQPTAKSRWKSIRVVAVLPRKGCYIISYNCGKKLIKGRRRSIICLLQLVISYQNVTKHWGDLDDLVIYDRLFIVYFLNKKIDR